MAQRVPYAGPALFSYGFRPFFLAAILFGTAVVPVWLAIWRGVVELPSVFSPVDWHIHEMIFGYAAAVIAGFLFTAVPNWTGRMPTRGWPLMVLATLWLAGRFAVWGALPLGRLGVALVDCGFLLAIAAMIVVEIVAGRNWRNLKVVIPVTLLFGANVVYHVEAAGGGAEVGRRLGLSLVLFLIMLIGGRIIPSFTRNWLAQRGAERMPVPFGRFDAVTILVAVVALAIWVVGPEGAPAGTGLALAGGLHLLRLSRWRGVGCWPSPLLLMLHVAYLFLSLGLICTAAAALGRVAPAAGLHILGIGAVGGMTVAVMMRATQGHTGRSLVAGPMLSLGFGSLALAALARAASAHMTFGEIDGIAVAAGFWTAAFGLILLRLTPWLALPAPARKAPSRP